MNLFSYFEIYLIYKFAFFNEDGNENVDAWLKLETWEKSNYSQIADNLNHEQAYETVRYIEDENERKHTLNRNIKELKYLVITFYSKHIFIYISFFFF
jgi:hypothetical protein